MDSHFSTMLDIKGNGRQQPFLSSTSFTGAKPGYYFGNGDQGLGYYVDTKSGGWSANDPETIPAVGQKRKYGQAAEDELDENDPADIDAYIAKAELNNEVEPLTAETMQQVYMVCCVIAAMQGNRSSEHRLCFHLRRRSPRIRRCA